MLQFIKEDCPICHGDGYYDVDAGGYSSHSVNQVFVSVTCSECEGRCYVTHEVETPDIVPLVTVCVALAPIQYCFDCRTPTMGSIGQAGFFWRSLCQACKDREDGFIRAQVRPNAIIVHAIDRISRSRS